MKQFGKNKKQLEYVKKSGKVFLKLQHPKLHLGSTFAGYIVLFLIAFILFNTTSQNIRPQIILYQIFTIIALVYLAVLCLISFIKTLNNYELAKEINGEEIKGSTLMNIIRDKEILRKYN